DLADVQGDKAGRDTVVTAGRRAAGGRLRDEAGTPSGEAGDERTVAAADGARSHALIDEADVDAGKAASHAGGCSGQRHGARRNRKAVAGRLETRGGGDGGAVGSDESSGKDETIVGEDIAGRVRVFDFSVFGTGQAAQGHHSIVGRLVRADVAGCM